MAEKILLLRHFKIKLKGPVVVKRTSEPRAGTYVVPRRLLNYLPLVFDRNINALFWPIVMFVCAQILAFQLPLLAYVRLTIFITLSLAKIPIKAVS